MNDLFSFENVNLTVLELFSAFHLKNGNEQTKTILKNFLSWDGEGKQLSVETPLKLLAMSLMDMNFTNAIFAVRGNISYITETQSIHYNRTSDISFSDVENFIQTAEVQHCINLLTDNIEWMNNASAKKLIERMAWIVILSVNANTDIEILDAMQKIIPAMVIVAIELKKQNEANNSSANIMISVMSHIENLLDQKAPAFFDVNCSSLLVAINNKYLTICNSSKSKIELLKAERNIHKDQHMNDNKTVMVITLPKIVLEQGGNMVFHCPELETNLSVDNRTIENAIRYTLSNNTCTCDFDCCGCVSTSVSASIVGEKYIQMNVRKSANY